MAIQFIKVPLHGGNIALVIAAHVTALVVQPNGGTAIHTTGGDVFHSYEPIHKFRQTFKYLERQQTDEHLR